MALETGYVAARRTPSLFTIVKTDFLALVAAIVPGVGIALAVAATTGALPDRSRSIADGKLEMMPVQPVEVAVLFAAAFVVAGAALLVWRLRTIRSAFATGRRVEGTITKLRPFKDRAYVHYEYRLNGVLYDEKHFVHQTAAYQKLAAGKTVSIAVDPFHPRKGFIAELFEG